MAGSSDPNSKVMVGAIVMALVFVSISKVMGMIPSGVFLLAFFIGLPIAIWFRVKHLKRLDNPEAKGNLETLRHLNFIQPKLWIKRNLMGHAPQVDQIMAQIQQNLALVQNGRHLGAYILMGPTGTGKTFFAHLLAESLFAKGKLLTIPMGQYTSANSDPDVILRMILDFQKESPEFVILLDEIDRAHANVRNSLFHFLDEGEIIHPDTRERFLLPCTITIATTNLGLNYLPTNRAPLLADCQTALTQSGFEKPLLARFDGVYFFAALNPVEVISVTLLQLQAYYRSFGIYVSYVGPEILFMILQSNQEYKEYGVRQLNRLVKTMSDPVIAEAKRQQLSSVVLEFDQVQKCVRIRNRKMAA